MSKNKKLSSDIIEYAVKKYWREVVGTPVPVVVYFYQKYEYEGDDEWEFCALHATPISPHL